jgi:S-adenosylmethionine:diacylglycerol 3-amino-3-carboxypropyl transferase
MDFLIKVVSLLGNHLPEMRLQGWRLPKASNENNFLLAIVSQRITTVGSGGLNMPELSTSLPSQFQVVLLAEQQHLAETHQISAASLSYEPIKTFPTHSGYLLGND